MTKLYFTILSFLPLFTQAQAKKNDVKAKTNAAGAGNPSPAIRQQVQGNPSVTNNDDGVGKVIYTRQDNSIEFSPLSFINNGALIQPVNRETNTGISTAFYIHDTASWSFFTNGSERLRINGTGNITSSVPLLINTGENKTNDALRVNGNVRIDSIFSLRAASDTLSYISFHRNIKSAYIGEDDSFSPYTATPTAWALDQHIPVFRMRHPNNVSSTQNPNLSVQRDFKILPYEFGMAIEFNGVVECWVGEWSVHRGDFYNDVEGKGNGWGGVSWVGDDQDGGGVRMTARNNLFLGGNVNYGEISVEKFAGLPNGDFRLRLPSKQNAFQFVYGERGSENIVAKMTCEGLILPKISSVSAATMAEKGQLLFDSTDAAFKGYNGSDWVTLSDNGNRTGSFTASADGSDINYLIPHGLVTIPSYYNVIATSADAANISYVTANAFYLVVHYSTAPIAGVNNLSWNWQIKK